MTIQTTPRTLRLSRIVDNLIRPWLFVDSLTGLVVQFHSLIEARRFAHRNSLFLDVMGKQ